MTGSNERSGCRHNHGDKCSNVSSRYQKYQENRPKTHSERTEFVTENAPKIVAGLGMIEKFFGALKKDAVDELMMMKNSVKIPN